MGNNLLDSVETRDVFSPTRKVGGENARRGWPVESGRNGVYSGLASKETRQSVSLSGGRDYSLARQQSGAARPDLPSDDYVLGRPAVSVRDSRLHHMRLHSGVQRRGARLVCSTTTTTTATTVRAAAAPTSSPGCRATLGKQDTRRPVKRSSYVPNGERRCRKVANSKSCPSAEAINTPQQSISGSTPARTTLP